MTNSPTLQNRCLVFHRRQLVVQFPISALPIARARKLILPISVANRFPDLVHDGENGFLCEVEDVERLAGCARRVIADAALRRTFAENGRETAMSCDFKAVAEVLYTQVYSPLLATLSGKPYKEESAT